MNTQSLLLSAPGHVGLHTHHLPPLAQDEVAVQVDWSGISTGTERLLYRGEMPSFPGMGYPLVPGYEAVGRVIAVGEQAGLRLGQTVFVPGARCHGDLRSLFGASASRLTVPAARAVPVAAQLGADAVLLALAATAYHAVAGGGQGAPHAPPDLIVGHGVLGRLLARLNVAAGLRNFCVWETQAQRSGGAEGYTVLHPDEDPRRDYRAIYDVSGDATVLDRLVARLAPGGEVVLAGFYAQPLSLSFAPAFMREARIRVAAEWKPADLQAVQALLELGRLRLDGLISHQRAAGDARDAYAQAFDDIDCLKMVLDWRQHA